MRGDSVRDLYAKTLALMGLGLLGAAGALVDYWPVHSDMPVVAAAFAPGPALPVPTLGTATSFQTVADRHVSRIATPLGLEVPVLDLPDGVPDLTAGPVPPLSVPLPPSLAVEPAETGAMPVSVLDLIPPVIEASEALSDASPAGVSAQNGDNRFAGAARGIRHAGAKAGTAVASGFVTAVSAVGHVFRW